MPNAHPLLGLGIKQTVKLDWRGASARYAKKEVPEEVEAVVKVGGQLDVLRDEAVRAMEGGGDVDAVVAKVWEYYQRLRHYVGHVTDDGIPDFQWTDFLAQKAQAAKSNHAALEESSLILNLAAVHSTHASNYLITGNAFLSVVKEYLLVAGIFKYLEEHHPDEAVFDLKKANLSAMQQLMLAQASHSYYLHLVSSASPNPKTCMKLCVDCLTQYTNLAAVFRVLEGINPTFREFIEYYRVYFEMKYWVHRSEVARQSIKEHDPYVEDTLGMVILGLDTNLKRRLPLPKDSKKYIEPSNELLTELQSFHEYLTTENRKVYSVRIPKELKMPDLVVSQQLKPKELVIPADLEDNLAQLPPAHLCHDYRDFKTMIEAKVAMAQEKAEVTMMEHRTELTNLQAVSLLSAMPSEGGPVLPESLSTKLKTILSDHPQPVVWLKETLAAMRASAEVCSSDISSVENMYNTAKAGDEKGFEEFGERWYTGSAKFVDMPEGAMLMKAVTDYKGRLESAEASNREMDERLSVDMSVLARSIAEHEEWLASGGEPVSEKSEDLNVMLDELAKLVNEFEIVCSDVEGSISELRAYKEQDLENLMPELLASSNYKLLIQNKTSIVEGKAKKVEEKTEAVDRVLKQISEKVPPIKERLSKMASCDKREKVAAYIANLDKLSTVFMSAKVDMKQGKDFYVGMVEACAVLTERMKSFTSAVEAQAAELRQILSLRNRTQNLIDNDAALAAKMAQEEQEQFNKAQQNQAPNHASIYPPQFTPNPYAYSSAPPLPAAHCNNYGARGGGGGFWRRQY